MKLYIVPRLLQVSLYQLSPVFCKFSSSNTLTHEKKKYEQSTIDEDEVKHFSEWAEMWWNKEGRMKGLHAMNAIRIPFIREGLLNTGLIDEQNYQSSRPLEGIKILDVGCGGGILSEGLSQIGADVTGIDTSQDLIKVAQLHAKQDPSICHHINYICEAVEEHKKENKDSYDAVVASEVLEHVNHQELFLESCVASLKPGGSIFITTPNRTFKMWAVGIILTEYILRMLPKGTHELKKCVKPHETQALLEKYGCTTKSICGMQYNFSQNKWSFSSNKNLMYALHAVRNKQ